MLCPIKSYKKYSDLTETDAIDLWISAKNIADNLKDFYHLNSIQYIIQDGKDAGQTIDQVHIHIVPIHKKRNFINDDIDSKERQPRSFEEMDNEAGLYRNNFKFK